MPLVGSCVLALTSPGQAQTALISAGSTWKYLDNGSNQADAWRAASFDDTAWPSGPAQLGYGDTDERTLVSFGPNSSAKYITTYFRRTFSVQDPTAFTSLKVRLLRDDGAAIYLNGTEIRRDNLPTGPVSYTTLATVAVGAAPGEETTFYETTIPTTALVSGVNVLAVEVHQQSGTSSDISFDLELLGVTTGPAITRGPYLQKATPTSLIVRWRTDVATDSVVRFGADPANLTGTASDPVSTTEHLVTLNNLTADTQYYYSVGSSTKTIAGGAEYSFFTPPPVGTPQSTRLWVIGDSGTANVNAAAVRDAYLNYTGTRNTDLWIMLGDNAYNNGTDTEFQAAVFNMYPTLLRETPLWSTLGNHEYYTSNGAPYFDIFSFPTEGEAGGEPSGTEKYYSFDYANIHFICLDSMSSDRTEAGPMAMWLQSDLESTSQKWIVAFWHHPPYTKGSHDSDNSTSQDKELVEMRKTFLPLLEAGGVDLVLGGHSHSYERSYLIDGHYGLSSTFTSSMKLDAGGGSEATGGVYEKPTGLSAHQGAVYAVAGSSGKATTWWGGSTADTNPSPHPAMFVSLLRLGSLVIDVTDNRMDVKFLRSTGAVDDSFSIVKSVPNTPPTVTISEPTEGTVFTNPEVVTVSAAVSDADGTVNQVDFYAGNVLIGTSNAAPFSAAWNRPPDGSHVLTAAATDNRGATTVSAPVNITVTQPLPPAPPTGLSATSGNNEVTLGWVASAGASSYHVKRATTSGGPYGTIASGITAASFTDTAATNGTRWFYVVSAVNTAGQSANSTEASALNNGVPSVSMSSPAEGASFPTGTAISVAAAASDDGGVARVDFYSGASLIGSDTGTPFAITWTGAPAGNHALTAMATDSHGATTTSATVNIVVTQAPTAPSTPTDLNAVASSKTVINLTWSDTSGNETGFKIERSTDNRKFTQIASLSAGVATYSNTGLAGNKIYYYRIRAYNSVGHSPYSNTASAKTPR